MLPSTQKAQNANRSVVTGSRPGAAWGRLGGWGAGQEMSGLLDEFTASVIVIVGRVYTQPKLIKLYP